MGVDPQFGVDRLTSAVLTSQWPQHIFCGTKWRLQNVQLLGTKGRVEVEISFNAPVDRPCSLIIQRDGFQRACLKLKRFAKSVRPRRTSSGFGLGPGR
jgi:hypothetical protein